jgi:hypothetical protein
LKKSLTIQGKALKSKWKLTFLLALLVTSTVGIAYALIKTNSKGDTNFTTSPANPPPNTAGKGGGVGNGTLYVYTDASRTNEAPKNEAEIYLVLYGKTYYFRIVGITEYSVGQTIHVWAHYRGDNYLIGNCTVGPGGTIDFEWTIPTLPYQPTVIQYKYGLNLTGPNPSWHFAKRSTQGVGLTFAIPQVPLGVLGAISAFIAAYGIKALTNKKHLPSK